MRRMLNRARTTVALLAAASTLAACGSDGGDKAQDSGTAPSTASSSAVGGRCTYTPDAGADGSVSLPPSTPARTGKVPVTITTTVGDLRLTLDADAAPCTVNSFLSLADQGFYEGVYCHRIGDPAAFPMLQCGDPTATDPKALAQAGAGGPGYRFPDELTGQETYAAGTLAMANSGPDTNGSQFFMVFGDIDLSPDYTVFGSLDAASVKTLLGVAAKGNDGSHPDGTGAPTTPVKFEKVSVG